MDKSLVKSRLIALLPDADVRIDKSEIVRVYWRRRIAFIHQPPEDSNEEIVVAIELLVVNPYPDLSSIEPCPKIVDKAYSEEDAAEKAAKWLAKVVEVQL
jgi:hypothetical protein